MMEQKETTVRCRIVLTGGPGGGKTTAADLFRREIGERVVVVPEAATLLFSGGFPRSPEIHARRSAQCAIYHVQRNAEGGNPTRIESNAQALNLDRRLREIWSKHPRFVVVPHNASFVKKIMLGLAALDSIVAQLRR